MPARQLPSHPNLDYLRNQAKDLLRDGRAGTPSALDDFREFHPERIDPTKAALADAQLVLARSYGALSWPQLAAAVTAIDAVSRDDFDALRAVAAAHPDLARDRDRPRDGGWRAALATAADEAIRRLMVQLRERGVHSSDGLLARPDLQPVLGTLRLLAGLGGRPAGDWVGGSVEVLRGSDFALFVEIGGRHAGHAGMDRARARDVRAPSGRQAHHPRNDGGARRRAAGRALAAIGIAAGFRRCRSAIVTSPGGD